MTWILCEDPGTSLWCLQPVAKCIQTRKHKYTFTTSISSWQCNYSKKRLLFHRLENSAKTTDIPMSGSAVKNHVWPKKGRQLCAKRTTSYLLVVPGLSTTSGSNSSSTPALQDLSSTSPAQERSDGPAPGDWCGSPWKTQHKNKKWDHIEIRTRLRDLPELLAEFTDNLEDTQVHAPAHISQDSDSESLTKVVSKSRKHSVCTHFPKRPNLNAQDALAMLYFEQKKYGDLITTQSARRYFSSIATIRIVWKMVGWFYAVVWNGKACEAIAICEMSKTSWQKGKLHTKDDLENHSKVIPLGAMVENHPIFSAWSIKTSSIWQGSITWWLSWVWIDCPGYLERRHSWLRIWKIWKSWTHPKFILEESTPQ